MFSQCGLAVLVLVVIYVLVGLVLRGEADDAPSEPFPWEYDEKDRDDFTENDRDNFTL